jgi:hypothetical protein
MSSSSTDTTPMRNPPRMLVHPANSFWSLHDSRRHIHSSPRTGGPKARGSLRPDAGVLPIFRVVRSSYTARHHHIFVFVFHISPSASTCQSLHVLEASHTQGTAPVTARMARRSRWDRTTHRAARRTTRRRRRRGGNMLGSSLNVNSSDNINSRRLNARMAWARKMPPSRA